MSTGEDRQSITLRMEGGHTSCSKQDHCLALPPTCQFSQLRLFSAIEELRLISISGEEEDADEKEATEKEEEERELPSPKFMENAIGDDESMIYSLSSLDNTPIQLSANYEPPSSDWGGDKHAVEKEKHVIAQISHAKKELERNSLSRFPEMMMEWRRHCSSGVPPIHAGNLRRAKYSSSLHSWRRYSMYGVRPRLANLSSALEKSQAIVSISIPSSTGRRSRTDSNLSTTRQRETSINYGYMNHRSILQANNKNYHSGILSFKRGKIDRVARYVELQKIWNSDSFVRNIDGKKRPQILSHLFAPVRVVKSGL